ncbi:predicted protein [Lichtheimia corymbifera JMRC:FSU:9682]|uniref:Uncharacterized protein n=1 Tax=Lichtheimia corymbifera JMRC:FSU:9682 TaxID=1263082 RepID=A0A068RM04_9FUNG|nr:predicted protein [Lichtheimia corymbifera JMRC:FSU:9682]
MTEKDIYQQQDGKGNISAAITEALSYWICNGYGWMGAIKCSKVDSWNAAVVTWRVVSRNDELYHVGPVEDDDGLDGMDTRPYIFDENRFTTMDDIATP